MKKFALTLACLATIATAAPSYAQTVDESSESTFSTPMTQQDFDLLQSQSLEYRGPGGWNPGHGGWDPGHGGWDPGHGGWDPGHGGWDPGHGGGHENHGWQFVGCGRRSKCVDMANRAGFPYGYAGIDANACPHDNACYGRY